MPFDASLYLLLLTAGVATFTTLFYVTVVFLIAQLKSDNSVMDIFYGPAFAVLAWALVLLMLPAQEVHTSNLLIAVLTSIWASRLCIRIARKNWGKPEDARYGAWREQWMKRGRLYFIFRSYFQINVLQGLIIVLVSLPMIIASTFASASGYQNFLLAGAAVWLLGLLIEATADYQLDRFIARKKAGTESSPLMQTGLFAYARRPNYFGESLIWWGFAIMVLPLPYGWLGLVSPLLITFILTRVTGPMLEEIFLEKYPTEYAAYMKSTSYFIPWWPKRD